MIKYPVRESSRCLSRTGVIFSSASSSADQNFLKWSVRGSNPRHPGCDPGALPAELTDLFSYCNTIGKKCKGKPPSYRRRMYCRMAERQVRDRKYAFFLKLCIFSAIILVVYSCRQLFHAKESLPSGPGHTTASRKRYIQSYHENSHRCSTESLTGTDRKRHLWTYAS